MSISRPLLVAACLYAAAATPTFAQGTAEQREACAPDAVRLCPDTIPDVGRTTACMERHKSELTPRCRRAFVAATDGGGEEVAPHRHRYSERTYRAPDDAGRPDYAGDEVPPPRIRRSRPSTLIEDDQIIVRELPNDDIYVYRR